MTWAGNEAQQEVAAAQDAREQFQADIAALAALAARARTNHWQGCDEPVASRGYCPTCGTPVPPTPAPRDVDFGVTESGDRSVSSARSPIEAAKEPR